MDLFFGRCLFPFSRKRSVCVLAFVWLAGLTGGLVTAFLGADSLVLVVRQALICSASRSGLLVAVLLPVALSGYAAFRRMFPVLIPVVFWEAFSFTFLGFGVMSACGSSGWLVRLLFAFSSSCMLPVLWLYWLRSSAAEDGSFFTFIPALSAALLIGCADYALVSPFLVQMLSV